MSQKPQPVSLTIMGKEYKIVCEPDEQDDLIRSAQQLDAQMRKMREHRIKCQGDPVAGKYGRVA